VHTSLAYLNMNIANLQLEMWTRPDGQIGHFVLVQLPNVPETIQRELAVHIALRGIEDFVLLSERLDRLERVARPEDRSVDADGCVPFNGVGYLSQYYCGGPATAPPPPFFMVNRRGRICRPPVPRQLSLWVHAHWAPIVTHGGTLVEGGAYHGNGRATLAFDMDDDYAPSGADWGVVMYAHGDGPTLTSEREGGYVLLWRRGRLYLAYKVDLEDVHRSVRTHVCSYMGQALV
jgi:hypothetical protein